MKRSELKNQGKGALELIEEALHLLRLAPTGVLAAYFLGALPFVAGVLYFFADMSATASDQHCAQAAFGLALLFVWMKVWQSVFACGLKAHLARRPPPKWTLARVLRVAALQAFVQPTGLFLLPIALLLVLPFPWVFAFYQGFLASIDGEDLRLKSVVARARQQALLWPGQNNLVLIALIVFAFFVFIDLLLTAYVLPYGLKTFLGIETVFTRSAWALLNTTFLAVVCGLLYLCLDPLIKAIYTLRTFHAESVGSGADLRAELSQFSAAPRNAVWFAALLLASLFSAATPAIAGERSAEALPRVAEPELQRSIREVVERREFSWRMPRGEGAAAETGLVGKFLQSMADTARSWLKPVFRFIKRVVEAVLDWLIPRSDSSKEGEDSRATLQILVYLALTVIASAVALLIIRTWRRRRPKSQATPVAAAAVPDLEDENVAADQLPENEWLALARNLLQQGKLRLAVRALYLACLSDLGRRELIALAKFKSNREYETELRRRAPQPAMHTAFSENVSLFERVWYGNHGATTESMQTFERNLERMKV